MAENPNELEKNREIHYSIRQSLFRLKVRSEGEIDQESLC